MFAFTQTATNELLYFEFGDPVDPDLPSEDRVREIMGDYARRQDELFDLSQNETVGPLCQSLAAAAENLERLKQYIDAIGRQRSSLAAPLMAGYLGHADAGVRREAILATGRIGNFGEMAKLERFLDDADVELREGAMIALSRSMDAAVVGKVRAAAGADPRLMDRAREAERRFSATESRDLREFTKEVIQTSEFEDLLWLQEAVVDYVQEILKDRFFSEETRRRAIWLLTARPVPAAGPSIDKVLRDTAESLVLRREAARGAGRIKRQGFAAALGELVGNEDLELARRAAEALGRIGAAAGLQPLVDHWGAQDGGLQPVILLAIRHICKYPSEWTVNIVKDKVELTMRRIWFIRDTALFETFQPGLAYEALGSPNIEARRDAILLLTFWGQPPDVRRLARHADSETDPANRQLASLGAERLARGPR